MICHPRSGRRDACRSGIRQKSATATARRSSRFGPVRGHPRDKDEHRHADPDNHLAVSKEIEARPDKNKRGLWRTKEKLFLPRIARTQNTRSRPEKDHFVVKMTEVHSLGIRETSMQAAGGDWLTGRRRRRALGWVRACALPNAGTVVAHLPFRFPRSFSLASPDLACGGNQQSHVSRCSLSST